MHFNFKKVIMILVILLFFSSISINSNEITFESERELCKYWLDKVETVLIEKQPNLPDEIYTGIMFLRFDAEEYFEEGKYDKCIEELRTITNLINIDKNIELNFPGRKTK